MKTIYRIILSLIMAACYSGFAYASLLDLDSIIKNDSNEFKTAAVYHIIDYPGFNVGGVTTNPPKPPADCDARYKYSSCPSGQKLNSDCCGGKCTACISCAATGGWSYTKPSVDNSRIRTTTQECGAVYYACNEGYKPITNSILGASGNLTSCPSHQNYISTDGGTSCAKCENKTCANYGYQDNNDTTKNCTAVSPYSGKNCYNCTSCPSNYVTCTSPQTGVGSPCGGKYSSCQCPSGVTNCAYGCKTYYTGGCSSVCMECKTQTIPAALKMTIDIANNCPTGLSFRGSATYIDSSGNSQMMNISCSGSDCYHKGYNGGTTSNASESILSEGATVTLTGLSSNFISIKSAAVGTINNVSGNSVTFTMNKFSDVINKTVYDYWTLQCPALPQCEIDGYSKNVYCYESNGEKLTYCPSDNSYKKCVFDCPTYRNYLDSTKANYDQMARDNVSAACGNYCNNYPVWPIEFCQRSWDELNTKVRDYNSKCGTNIYQFMENCPMSSCRDGMLGLDMCGNNGGIL